MSSKSNKSENICFLYTIPEFLNNAVQIANSLSNYTIQPKNIVNRKQLLQHINDSLNQSFEDRKIFSLVVIAHGYDQVIQCGDENELVQIKEILNIFIKNQAKLKDIPKYFFFNLNQKFMKVNEPPKKIPKIAFQRKPLDLTKDMTVIQFVIDGVVVEGNIDEAEKFEQLRNLFFICFEELNEFTLNMESKRHEEEFFGKLIRNTYFPKFIRPIDRKPKITISYANEKQPIPKDIFIFSNEWKVVWENDYQLNQPSKGMCFFVNQLEFTDNVRLSTRYGSETDVRNIKVLCEEINYKFEAHHNLKMIDMRGFLEQFKSNTRSSRKDELKHYDSFIFFFSSHGNKNGIYCRDSNVDDDSKVVKFSEIENVLKTSDCFGEKPVLIFFLCCRGDEFKYVDYDNIKEKSNQALICYGQKHGYISFRYPLVGTLFIMAFLKAFLTHGDKEITELLEEANRLMISQIINIDVEKVIEVIKFGNLNNDEAENETLGWDYKRPYEIVLVSIDQIKAMQELDIASPLNNFSLTDDEGRKRVCQRFHILPHEQNTFVILDKDIDFIQNL